MSFEYLKRELYLKYKDRYFKDFFIPEVRDLQKDKKEFLLNELESMRKNTVILENRREYVEEEDWEEEVWECERDLKNTMQRGVMAAHLVLDYPCPRDFNVQEVLEILNTSSAIAKETESDLYSVTNRKWERPALIPFQISESGKVFYEQCMRDYCDPKKRGKFLSIVNAEPAVKLAKKYSASQKNNRLGIER